MANVLIDPVIMVRPSDYASKTEIEAWLTNLSLWLEEATSPLFGWFYSLEITNLLMVSDLYPQSKILQEWVRDHKLNIDIKRIVRHLRELETNTNLELKLEDFKTKLSYTVLWKDAKFTPSEIASRWTTDEIRTTMQELLVTAAACKHAGDSFASEVELATLPLKTSILTKQLEIEAAASPQLVRNGAVHGGYVSLHKGLAGVYISGVRVI